MTILFFTSTNHELSQRTYMELVERGHSVTVQAAYTEADMLEAVAKHQPQLIIAAFLKNAIPASILQKHTVLMIRPGALSDRGPSNLRGNLSDNLHSWHISLVQSARERDIRDILTPPALSQRPKSNFYRHHVTQAAVQGILEAVEKLSRKNTQSNTALSLVSQQLKGRLHSIGL